MSKWAADTAVLLGIFCSLLVAGTPATAQPAKPAPAAPEHQPKSAGEYQLAVGVAYDKGRLSRALRLGEAGLAKYPDDAVLHHRYGVVLLKVVELDRARKHLEIARRSLSKNAELLVDLGWVYWTQGDTATASKLAAEATTLDPSSARAAEFRYNLDVQARIREKKSNPKGPEDPGGPAAFVYGFLTRIESGDLRGALERDVSRATMNRVVSGTGGNPAVGRDRIVRGFGEGLREAWKKFFGKPGNRYEGFDLHPEIEVKGAEHRVLVNVLLRRALDKKQVEQTRRFSTNPKFARYVDGETLAIIRGLDPDDRARFFERMVGLSTSLFVALTVVVVKSPAPSSGWKVTEVMMGEPPVAFSKLPGVYREAASEGLVPDVGKKRKTDLSYRLGYLVGLLLVGGGIILVIRRLSR